MNSMFSAKKFVNVNANDITWDASGHELELNLPSNVQDYEVKVDVDVDPSERWCEDGRQSGYEILCDELTRQLSDEYGQPIIDIADVEVID